MLLKQRTACTNSCFSFIVKDLHSRRMRGSRQEFCCSLDPSDPRTVGARDPARKTTIAANITIQIGRKLCDGRHVINLLIIVSCHSVISWSRNRRRTKVDFIRESYATPGREMDYAMIRAPCQRTCGFLSQDLPPPFRLLQFHCWEFPRLWKSTCNTSLRSTRHRRWSSILAVNDSKHGMSYQGTPQRRRRL